MSYANTANRPNPAAILGALGVPGAFGLILVLGLTITVVVPPPADPLEGYEVTEVKVDPIPPEVVEPTSEPTNDAVTPQPDMLSPPPRPDTDFVFEGTATTPVGKLPEMAGTLEPFEPVDFGGPVGPPAADPIAASPRGNAGTWITDSDYRTVWINREYSGVASFTLEVDARGRVTNCSITGSTGHNVLDQATCRLLQRRAEFNPAKDSGGNAVAGTFSSSVNWKIPE